MFADYHRILTRRRNYFSQLLNVHGYIDVRLTENHTAEPLVSDPSAFEVEMAIENLKSYNSPSIDLISADLIKAEGSKICSEIHNFINSAWNKKELHEQWKKSIIVPIYKEGNKRECNHYRGISVLSTAHKILSNILLSRLTT
jgi:hypothetical protein